MLAGGVWSNEFVADSSGSFIPADGIVVDWGNTKVESHSSVEFLNKRQDTTDIASSTSTTPSSPTTTTSSAASQSSNATTTSGGAVNPFPASSAGAPPDVLLQVPTLAVKRIELDVDDLTADINLNAQVANLVTVNAGVALSVNKVNLTITDIGAELELVVRLGHLTEIVNRVFQSLDLNPLLIATINNVTSILDNVIGQVDGLLGSITQGGTVLNFLIDNLGNIVQQVVQDGGNAVNSIVGNYLQNMTYTGVSQMLPNGLLQKQYKYGPLNALVNIVFNAANQLVSAIVVKPDGSGGSGSTSISSTTAAATQTSAASSPSTSTSS